MVTPEQCCWLPEKDTSIKMTTSPRSSRHTAFDDVEVTVPVVLVSVIEVVVTVVRVVVVRVVVIEVTVVMVVLVVVVLEVEETDDVVVTVDDVSDVVVALVPVVNVSVTVVAVELVTEVVVLVSVVGVVVGVVDGQNALVEVTNWTKSCTSLFELVADPLLLELLATVLSVLVSIEEPISKAHRDISVHSVLASSISTSTEFAGFR
jgi:hypothetical protein